MASSGWQGRQTLYGYTGSWYCCAWAGDLAIDSIERGQDYIRVRGNTAMVVETTSGCTGIWYNNRCGVRVQGEGGYTEIKGATNYNIVSGTTYYHSFDVTVTGLSPTDTSYNFSVSWLDLQNSSWLNATKSWTIYFDSATDRPHGGNLNWVSHTWNNVRIRSGVSTWGSGMSGTPTLEQIVVDGSATPSDWMTKGRRVRQTSTWNTSEEHGVSNDLAPLVYDGGIDIRGCTTYKCAMWAKTNIGHTEAFDNTTRYTPPSPLDSISVSQAGADNADSVTQTVTVTGGSHGNNHTATVTTYYRYKYNDGSFSSWTSMGTGNTWEAKTASFTAPYLARITIEAKQVFNGSESEIKTYTYNAINPTPPTGLTATITTSSWNSATMSVSCDYGHPNNISGRYIVAGLSLNKYDYSTKLESYATDVSSTTLVVDNNGSSPGASPFTIKGCTTIYPYVWATNTIWHTDYPHDDTTNGIAGFMLWGTSAVTPPAPLSSVTVTDSKVSTTTTSEAVLNITSSAENNEVGSVVYTQYKYKVGVNGTWTNWADVVGTSTVGATVTQQLTGLPQNREIYVEVRQYQTAGNYSQAYQIMFVSKQSVIDIAYGWNDLRDTLQIAATVSANATRCEILWGYTTSLGTTLVSSPGPNAEGTIQYPDHGTGQVIYARARAVALDGTTELGKIIAITVPNPIIGVATHTDNLKKYIVDIVEHKADNTITRKWANGQRTVKN